MLYFICGAIVTFIVLIASTVFLLTRKDWGTDDYIWCTIMLALLSGIAGMVWPFSVLAGTAFGVGYWIKITYLDKE